MANRTLKTRSVPDEVTEVATEVFPATPIPLNPPFKTAMRELYCCPVPDNNA